ncbi:MAG: cobalamin-dependent protein, partial [Candidatus Bathyarchaeota archaeon]|nr:cobalamin-dependent protein [Candidatus Bathyarchaeota archaeon]
MSIVAELREDEALQLVKNLLTAGENPLMILEACRKAVEIVGERFEKAEYFLPDLIMAGEILKEITELVKPKMEMIDEVKRLGKIVIGTVQGDIHDIGKDVVTFMLDANGFDVYDLGIDVPPQAFVEKIREVKPEVVALSGLLTLA